MWYGPKVNQQQDVLFAHIVRHNIVFYVRYPIMHQTDVKQLENGIWNAKMIQKLEIIYLSIHKTVLNAKFALKKANLNRKKCDCGLRYEEEIKCNKSRWLSCFKCGIWCCFDCLPESFQVNKISNLYFRGSCSENNEN